MGKRFDDYKQLPDFEIKRSPTFVKEVDEVQGVVTAFIAIMGNVDQGEDRIDQGAFTKTLSERGLRVKVLDQHQTDSVTRIVSYLLCSSNVREQIPMEPRNPSWVRENRCR